MKIFTNKNLIQKLIIAFVCVIVLNFCMAPTVVRAEDSILDSTLAGYIFNFLELLGDVTVSVIQYGFTGEWTYAVDDKGSGTYNEDGTLDPVYWKKADTGWAIYYPVIQISPELIFGNEVEILDVDFIGGTEDKEYALPAGDSSAISDLRTMIASWYVTLRTVAIVGLLSVLIYIGIRIIISSTSQDRAKYKQRLVDWIVAFCLLFFMHYIMAAVTTVVDQINGLLSNEDAQYIEIPAEYGTVTHTGSLGTTSLSRRQRNTWLWGNLSNLIYEATNQRRNVNEMLVELEISSDNITYKSGWETLYSDAGWTIFGDDSYIKSKTIAYTTDDGEERVVVLYEQFIDETGITNTYQYSYSDMTLSEYQNGGGASDGSTVQYYINYVRLFLNNSKNYGSEAFGWLIIYIVLIVFIGMFAIRYVKRVIYVAFLTLIAPLVALTYPIDKIKDRKSSSI